MKIEYVNISDLTPYENNAKLHTEEQITQIMKSIEEFGFNDPIAVWKDNVIIEGHGRYIASLKLGLEKVPVIRLEELTDEQRRAYMLVHNQLTMNTGFELEALESELEQICDVDMSEFGFELDDELETLFEEKEEHKHFDNKLIQQKVIDNWTHYETLDDLVKTIIDEPTAMYQFNRLCSGYNDGYNISLLFNPQRLDTETSKSKSIFYGINNDDVYKEQFARYMVNVSAKCVVPYQYYKYIGIGTGGYQYVNEFPPYIARDIYKRFCADGAKILNPCAGWGGRLLGVASTQLSDIEYVEIEPCKETFAGLQKLKTWLGLGDNIKQICNTFEEAELQNDYFDFVFTSPPYYDTEHYSEDDTQSYVRYETYDAWKHGFYFVMIDKIIDVLKTGGECVLNIGNVKYPLEDDLIDRLNYHGLQARRLNNYHIGGSGIGKRTGSGGEPFVYFKKE